MNSIQTASGVVFFLEELSDGTTKFMYVDDAISSSRSFSFNRYDAPLFYTDDILNGTSLDWLVLRDLLFTPDVPMIQSQLDRINKTRLRLKKYADLPLLQEVLLHYSVPPLVDRTNGSQSEIDLNYKLVGDSVYRVVNIIFPTVETYTSSSSIVTSDSLFKNIQDRISHLELTQYSVGPS